MAQGDLTVIIKPTMALVTIQLISLTSSGLRLLARQLMITFAQVMVMTPLLVVQAMTA